MGKYVPLEEQCWFASCKLRAQAGAEVQGKLRAVCLKHAKLYEKQDLQKRKR